MEALGILTVIGSVSKLAKNLHEIKEKYSNVALNTTLVASHLSIIRAALEALHTWRVNDPDQTAPAQQLDKDLAVSLSCCAILVSVIDGKLGESGYTPGLKGKIRHLWLEDILKEYISNLESQVRALQLLLTIFQCSSAAEQRQRLERADSRKIIEDVRAETATLGVESQEIDDRASIYSENPSVTFDVDSILMKSRVYQQVYEDVKRKPVPKIPQPPHQQKKEKPPVPPRLPARPGTKSQLPPIPPRPPPRRRGGAKAAEEDENMVEGDKTVENGSTEADHHEDVPSPKQEAKEVMRKGEKSLETGTKQDQSSRGAEEQDLSHRSETETAVIPDPKDSEKQNPVDVSNDQVEDVTHLGKSPKESDPTSLDQGDRLEQTNQISNGTPRPVQINCICGTEDDDGKLTHCETCNTWQHAECYYIDEFGIVPTNQDLKCIEHYCAECAPRSLHVDEAIKRKTRQKAEAEEEKSKAIVSLTPEPRSEPVKLELKDIPTKFDFGDRVASTAIGDFTSEMENAFRGVHYLPTLANSGNPSSSPLEPSVDANRDNPRENDRETIKPTPLVDKPAFNDNVDGSQLDVSETEPLAPKEPGDTGTEQDAGASRTLDNRASPDITSEHSSETNVIAPSIESAQNACEEPAQEEPKPASPTIPNLAPPLTTTSHSETQETKTREDSTPPSIPAKVSAASSDVHSADSNGIEDGLDKLISRIRSSRRVSDVPTTANARPPEDAKIQPILVASPPSGLDANSTPVASGVALKIDTAHHGRESFESKSITFGTSPPPHRPPPLPPTIQLASKPALVESVTSTESSERTSSAFDAASTISSELLEVNTAFTSNQSGPTDATSLGIETAPNTRTRAQSDLRRLQNELAAAQNRGDSKAKEESIQKSIQVIRDTYLTPPPEDAAASPKKSPRLGSRASFLRLPSLSSTKSRAALGKAITGDDEASIRRLLDEKANVNGRAEGGETPLMLAASLGHLTSMRLLKENGADECASDSKGRTALHIAVAYNHVSAVNWLLETYPPTPKSPPERTSKLFRAADLARGSRAPKNLREIGDAESSTALHVAAERGMVGMLKVLLTAGLDIEAKDSLGRTPLFRTILSQRRGCFDTLLQSGANVHAVDSKNMSTLHYAAASDQVDIIEVLLSRDVDKRAFDHDGSMAIHHAGRNGKIAAITALITSQSDLNTPTKTGERLLHLAVAQNHLTLAEHLLTSNVDVNPFGTPNPSTLRSLRPVGTQLIPLHYACVLGKLEMSILLLKHMAWVNAPTDTGMTALMMAADNEDTNLVNVLLEAGAKVNASVPGSCLTALHISARKGDLETVQQLCRAGANESAITSGSNGRSPIEEASKYADPEKKILVVEYLRILKNNKLLAKRKTMPRLTQPGSSSLSIRPGPGTPMAAQQTTSVSEYPWRDHTGYAMHSVLHGQQAGHTQGFGQYGMTPGPPPFYVPPLQQPQQQYQQQQPQQQEYFDPMGYEARFDALPAYEPGPGAPARLANRPGVYRPTP